MPGKIKVKVLAGRNLPVMDRASDTTDAFVEIKFGSVTHKTDVCRKSLNPHWSSTEWYRFEVDESELQDEPLQLRLMDHDTYSANDAIGKVVISLAPLLAREANNTKGIATTHGGAVLSGWIPVFDTMHGIRGELNVIVKVELFSDFNKYKTSSCGVQFFHCPMIPPGYKATSIHGFVEELVVNDDPEYQWIDKIRTPRASNEARQVAFIKLSNQVQRLVGLKAAELGANAVVGYQQDFDLEGEAGVVARAIGTAVSITPLPIPSQTINIPPCTQQQLKKYLDILATDTETITDLNEYFQTHPEELQKFLNILNPRASSIYDEPDNVDDDEKSPDLTMQSTGKSFAGSISIYQDDYVSQKSLKHISEDQTDLNRLLNRSDEGDSDSTGPLTKIKKFQTNFFFKRLRSRKGDKQDDTTSIKSNSSDTSRISLVDIKNEFKKFKRAKKPKFRKAFVNKLDEGVGMASILARSVIHAHTSLACIAETQDSEHSPNSTIRHPSESEPFINKCDEDKARNPNSDIQETKLNHGDKKIPELMFSSLTNISVENPEPEKRQRKISESCPTTPTVVRSDNLLKLPPDPDFDGSVSSVMSGESSELYSSSDEDDESSDVRTDTERTYETTSSVVQSVLSHEVNPVRVAQMDRKLSTFDTAQHDYREIAKEKDDEQENPMQQTVKDHEFAIRNEKFEKDIEKTLHHPSTSAAKDTEMFVAPKPNTYHFKFHNPFSHKKSKSISAPSSPVESHSFVYRSSKRIKHQLSKWSNSNMIKSISHYSLLPKKKHDVPKPKGLSHPNSASDVTSKAPSDTVLGSPFLSYADLLSLDKEGFDPSKNFHKSDELPRSKVSMYIGSEPVSRASLSGTLYSEHGREDLSHVHEQHTFKKDKSALKPTSLLHTAMETILIDKVQSLLPPSPDPIPVAKQFFDDVNDKLEKVEEARNNKDESTGLVHTAMETILLDKVQSLLIPTTPEPSPPKQLLQTIDLQYGKIKGNSNESSVKGMTRTAMETILMDKFQSVISPTSVVKINPTEKIRDISNESPETSGLTHTALETILIDKLKSLAGPAEVCQENIGIESFNEQSDVVQHNNRSDNIKRDKKCKEPSGLIRSAVETILVDKVQTLLDPTGLECDIKPQVPEQDYSKPRIVGSTRKKNVKEEDSSSISSFNLLNSEQKAPSGLIKSAVETVLVDKVQTLLDPTAPESDIAFRAFEQDTDKILMTETTSNKSVKEDDTSSNKSFGSFSLLKSKQKEPTGLIRSAVETILVDKVQSLLDPTGFESNTYQNVEKNDNCNAKEPINEEVNKRGDSEKSSGLLNVPTASAAEATDKESKSIESNKDVSLSTKDRKKLVRQESIDSVTGESSKISEDLIPCKITKPFLQHFHPILSGAPLETIPSLPESSLDHTESLDIDGVDRCQECETSDTNSASVCDNSHAACRVDRERERDRDKEKDKDKDKESPRHARHESYGGRDPVPPTTTAQNSSLNASSTPLGIHRRSSDSDLSVTPKGSSLNTSAGNIGSGGGAILRPSMNSNNLEMLEYPFLTMTQYPPGFIVHIGGTVCARSVKLVDGGGESAARAAWWTELRTELRAHARALRCNAVLAYNDTAAICEDVCVLSASGTAAVINLDCDFNADLETASPPLNGTKSTIEESEADWCAVGHVPYSPGTGPYRAELSVCGGCRRARVPAVLLATCSKPNRLAAYPKAVTLTAVAARVRRAPPTGEPGARDISDQLPFLEYELHKLLLAKLRMQGANALFNLQTQVSIGERCVMALASGTAVRLTTLPPPMPPRIKASENDKEAIEIQKALWDTFTANKLTNGYDVGVQEHSTNGVLPETEGEEPPVLDLCSDKDACVLELDEAEDVETARTLSLRRIHTRMQVFTNALKPMAGAPPHAFAQVWRARLTLSGQGGLASSAAERHVSRALDGVTYKLRRLQPCAMLTPRFQLELPEDEIQLVVSGAAIPLVDPSKPEVPGVENGRDAGGGGGGGGGAGGGAGLGAGDGDDDIFVLDEEQLVKTQPQDVVDQTTAPLNGQSPTTVSLTTLSYICGARVARRVCALRLLFVRETTAVRELGGLSGFLHTFTCEVLAIVRAYTAALGGNALTSFYITQLMLQDNAHKNQGQCLLSVGGDVVHITY